MVVGERRYRHPSGGAKRRFTNLKGPIKAYISFIKGDSASGEGIISRDKTPQSGGASSRWSRFRMSQIDPFDTPKLPDLAEQGFPVAPSPRVLGRKGQNGRHISVPLSKYFYLP